MLLEGAHAIRLRHHPCSQIARTCQLPALPDVLDDLQALPVQSVIAGAAVGIALDELRDLLTRLVVVNDRPDLLAQYNRGQEAYGRWMHEARG